MSINVPPPPKLPIERNAHWVWWLSFILRKAKITESVVGFDVAINTGSDQSGLGCGQKLAATVNITVSSDIPNSVIVLFAGVTFIPTASRSDLHLIIKRNGTQILNIGWDYAQPALKYMMAFIGDSPGSGTHTYTLYVYNNDTDFCDPYSITTPTLIAVKLGNTL